MLFNRYIIYVCVCALVLIVKWNENNRYLSRSDAFSQKGYWKPHKQWHNLLKIVNSFANFFSLHCCLDVWVHDFTRSILSVYFTSLRPYIHSVEVLLTSQHPNEILSRTQQNSSIGANVCCALFFSLSLHFPFFLFRCGIFPTKCKFQDNLYNIFLCSNRCQCESIIQHSRSLFRSLLVYLSTSSLSCFLLVEMWLQNVYNMCVLICLHSIQP